MNKLMKFTQLISEENLSNIISKFGETHDTYEYMTGDCYAFAAALYSFMKKGNLYIATGENGGEHAFYEFNNKFYDAYGEHKSKEDLISDADIDMDGEVTFKKVSYEYMSKINKAEKLIASLVDDFKSFK